MDVAEWVGGVSIIGDDDDDDDHVYEQSESLGAEGSQQSSSHNTSPSGLSDPPSSSHDTNSSGLGDPPSSSSEDEPPARQLRPRLKRSYYEPPIRLVKRKR